jgi:hypothetical protein
MYSNPYFEITGVKINISDSYTKSRSQTQQGQAGSLYLNEPAFCISFRHLMRFYQETKPKREFEA